MTTIHCINVVDRVTGERARYNDHPGAFPERPNHRKGTIADGVARLATAAKADGPGIAGQNIVGFDIPAIQKLYPDFQPDLDKVVDALVISRLIWTDLRDMDMRMLKKRLRPPEFQALGLIGKHSLEAWGYRFGNYKGDYAKMRKAQGKALGLTGDDLTLFVWGTFTADMDDYCAQDVEVTCQLLEKAEEQNYSPFAIWLEHRVRQIVDLQEGYGFLFDREAAERLQIELVGIKAELEDHLREAFQPWFEPERYKGHVVVADPKRRRSAKVTTEDGHEYRATYEPGQTYCKVKLVSFEPGSRDKIANRLIKLFGWTPQEFTPTGKPKVDETTLDGLLYPEAKLLKKYLTVDKRLGQLASGDEAWLKRVREDGRIHGRVNTNGAVTGRMTHNGPNMAQVPAIRVDEEDNPVPGLEGGYGLESRALFIAAPSKLLVGTDAEGLELRMLAHYMARFDSGAYVETVVHGKKSDASDVHSVNQRAIGLNSRYNAKTWIYAYLYGAGNFKLGTIMYEDMTETQRDAFNARHAPGSGREQALSQLGARGRSRIEKGLPALGKLVEEVKLVARKNGHLRSLDGRRLHVRAQHSALNTLLQGGGAIVMKLALVFTYDSLVEREWQHGREFGFVANVHDEFQAEVDTHIAEEVGQIAAEAIRRAGEHFDLRCPLAGSSDVGRSWAETH